jgi:hypothetical protein
MKKKIVKKRNLTAKIPIDNVIATERHTPLEGYPPWYEQVIKLPEKVRREIQEKEMDQLRRGDAKAKVAYNLIHHNGLILVGFMPKVEYCRHTGEDLEVNWVHHFSRPTLLFYNPQNNMGIFINAVLRYNDTILNEIRGNARVEIEGWTG